MTHKRQFDSEGFYAALERTVRIRNVTWKDVSDATGVSQTTLTRMGQGRKPDAASMAALSAWAGINPARFVPPLLDDMTNDRDPPVNHEEASLYAQMHPESNLARCYLELDAQRTAPEQLLEEALSLLTRYVNAHGRWAGGTGVEGIFDGEYWREYGEARDALHEFLSKHLSNPVALR